MSDGILTKYRPRHHVRKMAIRYESVEGFVGLRFRPGKISFSQASSLSASARFKLPDHVNLKFEQYSIIA